MNPSPHNVTDEHARYYRKDFKRKAKGKAGLTAPPGAPFGEVGGMPIQGPPNWNQIWSYDTMGHDARKTIPATGCPLTKAERRYIKSKETLLTDVKWIKKLGEGAFGQIWLVTATMSGTNQRMACKVIKPRIVGPAQFEDTIDILLSDMKALRFLNHQNIVQMKEYFPIPDMRSGFPFATVLLFMELCDGDLYDLLDESLPDRLFPEPMCRHWFKQIATGLEYIHKRGVAHLDIKPENIFYVYDDDNNRQSRTGNPLHMTFKLGDFGLSMAILEHQDFKIKEARGTDLYMGTEMQGYISTEFDARASDVYSLGVTLARSILGRDDFANHVFDLHGQMILAMNRATSNLNISPEGATLIAAMINPSNYMRPKLPVILQSYQWTTTDVTNPSRVRSAFTPPLFSIPRPNSTIGALAMPVVMGLAAAAAYLVLRNVK